MRGSFLASNPLVTSPADYNNCKTVYFCGRHWLEGAGTVNEEFLVVLMGKAISPLWGESGITIVQSIYQKSESGFRSNTVQSLMM